MNTWSSGERTASCTSPVISSVPVEDCAKNRRYCLLVNVFICYDCLYRFFVVLFTIQYNTTWWGHGEVVITSRHTLPKQSAQGNGRDSWQLTARYPQSIFFYDLLSLHRTTVYTGQQSWQQTADSMLSTVNIILWLVVSTQDNSRDSRQLTAWYPQSILFYYLLSLHSTTVMPAC